MFSYCRGPTWAARWPAFVDRLQKFAGILGDLYQLTPPDIDASSVREVLPLFAVGRKLRQVARARQVLCVTHLPQIASYADHHLRAEKREDAGRSTTSVAVLAKADRVREVARMLGGESVTDTSLRHALELITQARAR